MQNCGIKVEHKSIIEQIKEELKLASYTECGNCGAVMVNAKELARAIHQYTSRDEEEDDGEMRYILCSITELVPDCFGEEEIGMDVWRKWEKWESDNTHRLCSFIDGYEGNVYTAYAEVILYTDETCTCFKEKLAS